ncbi:MAG: YgjP-like metallopeptidase domain-containing protein, partial [Candidatus Micrarchaeia archaeon]
MPKVNVDNLEIPYAVSRRNVRYPRLEFRTGKLVVVMPKGKKSAEEVINKHKTWIKQKKMAIGTALNQSKRRKLTERSVSELKEIASSMIKIFHLKYGFVVGQTYIRKMNSKWASHSRNGNLTLNGELRFLPKNLIEYVI